MLTGSCSRSIYSSIEQSTSIADSSFGRVARCYYNPTLRRFINQDTVLGAITTPASMNRFAYANGNPVSGIDPFGTVTEDLDPMNSVDADEALAASSYNSGKSEPARYAVLQTFTRAKDGTNAVLYYDMDSGDITLAYRGTVDLTDWKNNVVNAIGGRSSEYVAAVGIARDVQNEYPDALVELTGHSLGGGEAALAAAVAGTYATTFNAAGVKPANYGYSTSLLPNQVVNYHVATDALSFVQAVTPLSSALGKQVTLAPANLFYALDPLAAHSMQSVQASSK